MKEISDGFMKSMMLKNKNYTAVILKASEKIKEPRNRKNHLGTWKEKFSTT
jgi:hypothetical protein